MTTVAALIEAIDRFLIEAGLAESTFGKLVVNDGKFVSRIRNGGGVTVATVEKVECFIAKERSTKQPQKRRRGAR